MIVAIGELRFGEFAEVEVTDTRDEVEEDTVSVPLRLERDVFVRQHLVTMQEREAVRVIRITLVAIRLPEERLRDTTEERTCLERIRECAAHA